MYEQISISDIADVVTGKTPSTKDSGLWEPDIPFITPKELQATKHIATTDRHVSNAVRDRYSRQVVPAGSVCVSCIGNLGYVGVTEVASLTNQQINTIVPNDPCDSDYLYYVMRWLWPYFKHLEGQSTTLSIINKSQFKRISIPWPNQRLRRRISDILNRFDDMIELNLRTNDYLTTLASAIYREFVSHASGSMGVLADLVDLRKDSTKAGERPELPYLPIDAIPMKSIGISEFKPNHEAKSSLQLFQRDDIIIGAMRVYFHRVVLAPCEGITRNTCFVLRPKNQLLREYALLTCFQPEAIEYANARAKGSTMPYAVWEGSFEAYPVLIPDESELEMFSKRVSPIIDKLRDSFDENGRLAKLRDALLPKLMSGEIDVSKVEMPTQPNNHLSAG